MYTLTLEITKRCNLKCRYCYVQKNEDMMQLDVGYKSIDISLRQVFIRSIQHEQCFFVSPGTGKESESHIHITASHDGINGRWAMVRKSLKIVLQKSIESDFRFVFPF